MELLPLPEDLRTSLPPAVQAYLTFLEARVASLERQLAGLRTELETLRLQVAEAQARARQHSGTSSRPPSSDPPSAPPRPRRPASGRLRGGQPGHRGQTRALLPCEQVAEIVEHRPTQCACCQAALPADLPAVAEPVRQQVWEVPAVVQPAVTEHRYYTVCCPACHTLVPAQRPAGVPPGAFGPQVTALVGLLHGRYRLSVRETAALLQDLWGVSLALGSVPAVCQEVSAALAPAYAAAQAAVQDSPRVNVDETSWQQAGQRQWLWVAVGVVCTLFVVATTRSAAALTTLLGATFGGIVGSDRYSAYRRLPVERRQVCWAHLTRDFAACTEWAGAIGAWGQEALALVAQVFAAWHRFRTGAVDRAGLQAALAPVQADLQALLQRGLTLRSAKAQALCRDLLALWPALWTFGTVEGVEPTNNAAEQALRPAVLWRKGCFGTQSATGTLFVQRILTVAATCRHQQRHLLTFLAQAVHAHWAGLPTPSLISTP